MAEKKRQPNFSANEKFLLISQKYKEIVENKVTDKISMSEKDMAWRNIEKDFNATSHSGLFRDRECLKRFYENRKREVRKMKAMKRQEMYKTGGGPETKIVMDAADELLINIMNIKTIEGLLNTFDSDEQTVYGTTEEKAGTSSSISISDNNISSILDYEESKDNSNTFSIKRFKKADDLTKPRDLALRPLYLNNNRSTVGTNIVIVECEDELIAKNNFPLELPRKLDGLRNPIDSALIPSYLSINSSTGSAANDTVVECTDKHEKNDEGMLYVNEYLNTPGSKVKTKKLTPNKGIRKGKNIPQRGPGRSGIQILATSHIAKKYDELLDLRKVLLEKQIEIANQDLVFQRTKHKLEIEILSMKVASQKRD